MSRATTVRQRFAALLEEKTPIIIPGAYDAPSAWLVKVSGYSAAYVGSYGTAAASYGLPNVGALTMNELSDYACGVAEAVSIPVLLTPRSVRVNAVAPGTIHAPLTDAYFGEEALVAGLEATVPLGVGGTPADVGNAVLFLTSPMAAFITGVVLPVDACWVAEKSYSPGATGGAYTSSTAGSVSSPDSGPI